MTVGVVIPYYQRESGVLARALRSVAAQTDRTPLRVVVVDDGSPVPAADELKLLHTSLPVEVILQPNAGPGAARNTALAHLGTAVDYIAFLDSDDEWHPTHLARALQALEQGHDVYFSNLYHLGQTVPAFERTNRLLGAEHTSLAGDVSLKRYGGDMLEQIVLGNVIGTSSVVYAPVRFDGHRFLPQFRRAGEDYLFWMGLAARNARFTFGTQPTVTYGRGVNIYSGAGWGTDGFARRAFDEHAYRLFSRQAFALSSTARAHIDAECGRLAMGFGMDVLHRLKGRRPVDWALARAFIRRRPLLLLDVGRGMLSRLTRR